ncbi:universal stress protein [Robertkochia solimangrovi]|uniref:universal stress protein n=1 Tax=Robertkochia solimangrovi TaxID=2213046 RepID=UPI0011806A4D|nr:universal stress protein [Robertkochia solimangrovi]TRZ43264.1 universal stress protein [Robertkochia solimangrovi]
MKKILVPTDFSEFAGHALDVAIQLARTHGAKIYLLHMMGISQAVIGKGDHNSGAESIYYLQGVKAKFQEMINSEKMQGIEVEEIVQNYKIFSEVNEVAKEKGIDLIVMGSHGTGFINDFFVGSNTEKVVRNSDIPVLVIKKEHQEFKTDSVVLACDFKFENIGVYRKAMKFFSMLRSQVYLVYINVPNQNFLSSFEMEERVDNFLMEADNGSLDNKELVHYYCDYTIENGIYEFCKKVDADIISLPTHGRKGISHFFMGSIGEDVANHATLPVITFKIQD